MLITQMLAAGAIAGILSNVTGYAITGRLFHRYQARTPNTWRAAESWGTIYIRPASECSPAPALSFSTTLTARRIPSSLAALGSVSVSGQLRWFRSLLKLRYLLTGTEDL